MSYRDRLKNLNLPTLELRRLWADLVQVFKITRGIDDLKLPHFLVRSTSDRTRGHTYKLVLPKVKTRMAQDLFHVRVVLPWNSLPQNVVNCDSVYCFRQKLKKLDLDRFLRYN